ncbi:DUF975 family protein [Anaeromicropila herbilytica]|uniref:Membrane protein n=1 Tax=Anaeromicropila herbilytica TaxID=2785025 RepID=A0A7R7EJT6_9FIRM|nr:DUF975 family protein [Anaeromicropila herbilytica]BCN30088.1 membrane protein [Anaeromicropila herbilytica]
MNIKDLRYQAWQKLKENYVEAFFVTLIYLIINSIGGYIVENGPFIISLALFIIYIPLTIGVYIFYLRFTKGNKVTIDMMFDGYRKRFVKAIGLGFMLRLYIFLWSFLLIIPGIIKALSYSMSYYIFDEKEDLSINEVISLSREMMKGYELELFLLNLSFLGWVLLCILTCGLATFWVHPYIHVAKSNFYLKVKKEYYDKELISAEGYYQD